LVEECMVAANRCAARFLAQNNAGGPFVIHPGFRANRIEEVHKFLTLHAPHLAEMDPASVEGYREIMHGLANSGHTLPLRSMVNRLLTRAELSTVPGNHMGMALEFYTNCTSPLRKYVDFLVHLQIKAVLNDTESELVSAQILADLNQRLANSRSATQEAERWLASNYLARLASGEEVVFKATIAQVTSSGFNARMNDNGLNGFVDLRKDPEKFSYDKWTASLTSSTRRFQLDQQVELRFLNVDIENQHQTLFEPIVTCGLKPPKEKITEAREA
jgi:exoribonuclease R